MDVPDEVKYYTAFLKRCGSNFLSLVLSRFSPDTFYGTWNQVATSRSTSSLGTGTALKSVQAVYGPQGSSVSVLNSAIAPGGIPITIKGTSYPVLASIPTCRKVVFPSARPGSPGDYWIVYISSDGLTLIVGAPLITEGCLVSPSFGLYIITKKTREEYWADTAELKNISNVCKKLGYNQCWNLPVRTD